MLLIDVICLNKLIEKETTFDTIDVLLFSTRPENGNTGSFSNSSNIICKGHWSNKLPR